MATVPPPELHDGKSDQREVFKLINWLRRTIATVWPALGEVLVSNGTGPVGDPLFTYDVDNHRLTLSGRDAAHVAVSLAMAGDQIIEKGGTGDLSIGTAGAQDLNLLTNDTLRLRLDSSGNLQLPHYSTAGLLKNDAGGNVTDATLTSTGGTITVTNGNGAAGNPNVDLPAVWAGGTLGGVPGYYLYTLYVDAQGRVSAADLLPLPTDVLLTYAFYALADPSFGGAASEMPTGYSASLSAISWRYTAGVQRTSARLQVDALFISLGGGSTGGFAWSLLQNGVAIITSTTLTSAGVYDSGAVAVAPTATDYFSLQLDSTGVAVVGTTLEFTASVILSSG